MISFANSHFARKPLQQPSTNPVHPMKRTTLASLFALLCAWLLPMLGTPASAAPPYRPDRILVKPKPGVATATATAMRPRIGARLHRRYPEFGLEVLQLDKTVSVEEAIRELKMSGAVEYAEPDYELHILATPNDPRYADGSMWGLHNTGQSSGTNDADIDAPEAWDIRNNAGNIIVAVIDTGVRYTHEDLAANMWRNPGETAGDGIDNDGNGLVDDVFGINAVAGNGNPNDDQGHGTHCAGTIGAVGNNGKGVVGVAWRVQLMACKFLTSTGSGATSDAIECINYARAKGAHIMSNSWGGGGFSQGLNDAITAARNAGIIFVAAAGNESKDNDASANFPSNFPQDNIVAVASSTRTEALSSFSNFGRTTVDIAAPGSAILSTVFNSDSAYGEKSGTSMATPHVAGAMAVMKANFPNETYLQLITRLYNSADRLTAYTNRCTTGGRLNLQRALGGGAGALPVNDAFANASQITGSTFTVGGSTVGATRQTGEPQHGGNAGGASIWWRWTAANDGPATFTTENSSFNTLLGVYTGTAVGSLNLVATNNDVGGGPTWSRVTFNAVGGMTYVIAVDGFNGATGSVVLNGQGPSGVLNDNFAARTALNGASFTATANSVDATEESGEPNHVGNAGGKSVWWTWSAPASGAITVTTDGSTFDTLLAVYTGSTLTGLAQVAADDDAGPGTTSLVTFTATAGTTYQIAVDGYRGSSGTTASGDITLRGTGTAPTLPTVTVTAPDPNATEDGDTGSFTVSRTGSTTAPLVVNLERTGTAVGGSDYQPLPTSVTIPAGVASATLTLVPIDDAISEQPETVILTIATAAAYTVGSPASATVNLADNDTASAVTAEATDASAGEAGDPGMITLRRAGSTAQQLSVNVQIGGSATPGSDYQALSSPVTIPAGQSSVVLNIVPVNDAALELSETVSLTVVSGAGYVVGAPATANVTLQDDDSTTNNDFFAQRATLAGSTFSTGGSNSAATKEAGEPNHASIAGGKSLWYRWTAPAAGETTFDTFGSNFDTLLAIYIGTDVAALTEVTSNDDAVGTGGVNSQVTFTAILGTTYLIAVDGYRGASGNFVLNGSGATTGLPSISIQALVPTTQEGAAAFGILQLTRSAGSAELTVNVLVGGSATSGADYSAVSSTVIFPSGFSVVNVPIQPVDDADLESAETVQLTLAPGAGYLVGTPSVATVTITDNDSTSNNDPFAGAFVLTGESFSTTGANPTATKETGEPNHAGNAGGKSVWWSWTAPVSATVTIGTTGSGFDTVLGVYTGNAVDALTPIASNDDGGPGLTSQVTFAAVAGTTYRLAVDGFSVSSGNVASGSIVLATGGGGGEGGNDLFANRANLGDRKFNVTAANLDATREAGEPDPGGGEKTLWWTWTPGASGPATISTKGSDLDTVLAVYTGNSIDTLREVARNDDFSRSTSKVVFDAQANTAYQIVVGGFFGATGNILLTGTIKPFSLVLGSYHGLVQSNAGVNGPLGTVSLKITATGRFTGAITYGGERYRVTGTFDEIGDAFVTVERKGGLPPLEIFLHLDVSGGRDQVTGSISDGAEFSDVVADRALFKRKTNPAPQAGRYTLLFEAGAGLPQGIGHGSVKVSERGAGRFIGVLSDGTKISQGVLLSKDGYWPFYIPLYRSAGLLTGYVLFQEIPGESDFDGLLFWQKPPGLPGAYYPGGFTGEVATIGSRYEPVLPVLDFGAQLENTLIEFAPADLAIPRAAVNATLPEKNKFEIDAGEKVSLKLNVAAGTLRGSFLDAATGRKRTISGAVFQKQNYGAGLFRGTAETGAVTIQAAAP